MEEITAKKKEIEAFLDAGNVVNISIEPKNRWERILQYLGLKPKSLIYKLRKIRVGNRERIAARGFDFPTEVNNGTYIVKRVLELTKDLSEDLRYCAAVALQNDRFEPKPELLDALRWVDDETLFQILDASLSQLDISNFLNSIVLITGTQSLTKAETS